MKQIWIVLVFSGWFIQIPDFSRAEDKAVEEFKSAQECYDAALSIKYYKEPYSFTEHMSLWGRKYALLERAIALDPKFTDAYIPYVMVFFEQPMGHELDDSREIEGFIELLKKGLEYNPPNGDEFFIKLVDLEDRRFGSTDKESVVRSIRYLDEALSRFPKSTFKLRIIMKKSYLYECLGNKDERIRILEDVASINDPKEDLVRSAYHELMKLYFDKNDFEKAIKYADKSLDASEYEKRFEYNLVLWYKIDALSKLEKHEEVISCSNLLLSYYKRNPKRTRQSDLNAIYAYMSQAYKGTGDLGKSEKFKALSERE